jgi:cysteine synthase A
MKANTILDTIGNTPHVRLQRLFPGLHEVWLKLERANPGGSIKDRIAKAMIEAAEQQGLLNRNTLIVEPTSGNTGIGLAMVAAVKGYQLLLVMPESMSIERRRLMVALGAQLELTPKEQGMPGAIARAQAIVSDNKAAWMPSQFTNPANVAVHREQTAQEILSDFGTDLDFLITGVGTGGHITGCAQVLKQHIPSLQAWAVEPAKSPVISGGAAGPHKLQGIGAGFIPEVLDVQLLDGTIQVTEELAFEYVARAAREEGILLGISSGATLAAIALKLKELDKPARVLGFCYDTGERYLSVDGLYTLYR